MEVEEGREIRTIRMIEPAKAQDLEDLSGEVVAMDVDRAEEPRDREQARARDRARTGKNRGQAGAGGRDRTGGRDRNTRGRGREGRFMDD